MTTTTRTAVRTRRTNGVPHIAINELTVPPQNLQTERCVFGGELLDSGQIDAVRAILKPEDFYSNIHATVQRVLNEMCDHNAPVDVVTVANALESRGELADIGGPQYLTELLEAVPHAAHTVTYAKQVLELSRRRAAVNLGRDLMANAHDKTQAADDVLNAAESQLHGLIEGGIVGGPKSIGDILLTVLANPEQADEEIPTGFDAIDHLKNSKLMFGSAVKARRVSENPFNGISSQLVKRPDRMAFVEGETIQRVLNACPTARWRAIVVLCRYSGLRCPSEVFALRWSDVDFDRGRMRVRSPKGENFGKGIREVPLFPEVRSVLEVLFIEPDGGEFVITSKDRSSAKNLRTMFEKILRKAGVDPWPRLTQNLRSSRETELANEYPIQTVTAWLGNTPRVALENYLQVRDEDFNKASKTTRIPTQQASADSAHGLATVHATNENTPCFVGNSYKTRGVQDSSSAPTRART